MAAKSTLVSLPALLSATRSLAVRAGEIIRSVFQDQKYSVAVDKRVDLSASPFDWPGTWSADSSRTSARACESLCDILIRLDD